MLDKIEKLPPDLMLELGKELIPHASQCVPVLQRHIAANAEDESLRNALATLLGVVSPGAFSELRIADNYVDAAISSVRRSEIDDWIQLTYEYRQPLLQPLIDRYGSTESPGTRETIRRCLVGLLQNEPQNLVVEAVAGVARRNSRHGKIFSKRISPRRLQLCVIRESVSKRPRRICLKAPVRRK